MVKKQQKIITFSPYLADRDFFKEEVNMGFNPNMANKEVADLILLQYKDKKPFLNLDFANVTTTGLESERSFATGGKGAPNRIGFDSGRKGTLVIETQITPMKLYAMLAGVDIENKATFLKREIMTATTNKITIPSTDTIVAGSVYVYEVDDDCGTDVSTTIAGNVITLATSTATEFIVYYLVNVSGVGVQRVKFNSKTFPKAFTIYGETPWKTEDDEIAAMKLTYYKAQPQSSLDLSFSNSGDPTSLSITCDLLADENDDIYDMSIVE